LKKEKEELDYIENMLPGERSKGSFKSELLSGTSRSLAMKK
jgi:hypothetical protein